MFKNKYLKQLQEVQVQIRTCKASLSNLKPPSPDSLNITKEMKHWFELLFYQHDPSMSSLIGSLGNNFTGNTLDYMKKLGEFFVNTAEYYKAEEKYKAELMQLQKEEHHLKEKLGID